MEPIGRKLADGLYAKLEFDFACQRGHIFNEHYLHSQINEILGSNIDPRQTSLEPSFAHPELQISKGSGRKREIDFALVNRETNNPQFCIEAKWAGSSHCTEQNVLRDVCRLAAIHQADPKSTSLFVLAGGKDNVANVLKAGLFTPDDNPRRGLLVYPAANQAGKFYMRQHLTQKQKNDLSTQVPNIPDRVHSVLYGESHLVVPNWRVLVWRIE